MNRQHDRAAPVDRWHWLAAAFVAAGLLACAVGAPRATAAQEAPNPHEITIYFTGKDYDDVGRTHITLGINGKPLEYESRATCQIAITRLRVEVKGARLRRDPVDPRRVK